MISALLASACATQPEPRESPASIVTTDDSAVAAIADQSIWPASSLFWSSSTVRFCVATWACIDASDRHWRARKAAATITTTVAATNLLEVVGKRHLRLRDVKHRGVDPGAAFLHLADVAVVHPDDELLVAGDGCAQRVAQVGVRAGQVGRDLRRLAIGLKRLQVGQQLLGHGAALAIGVARDLVLVVRMDLA